MPRRSARLPQGGPGGHEKGAARPARAAQGLSAEVFDLRLVRLPTGGLDRRCRSVEKVRKAVDEDLCVSPESGERVRDRIGQILTVGDDADERARLRERFQPVLVNRLTVPIDDSGLVTISDGPFPDPDGGADAGPAREDDDAVLTLVVGTAEGAGDTDRIACVQRIQQRADRSLRIDLDGNLERPLDIRRRDGIEARFVTRVGFEGQFDELAWAGLELSGRLEVDRDRVVADRLDGSDLKWRLIHIPTGGRGAKVPFGRRNFITDTSGSRRLFVGPGIGLSSMHEDLNWAIGGEAGDGIDSTGKIFARALSRAGRHVFTSKDFASRIRGGYTAYKVRTAVDTVESVVDRLDILIALTERTIDENLDELHEGSVIIYDGEQTTMQDVEIPDGMVGLPVPIKDLAVEAGGAIMRNVVALGAACEVANFPIENLDEALEKRFGGKGQAIVENNKEAARMGRDYVQDNYDYDFEYDLETTDNDYVLLNGDEAIGMGAIAAGCRFYAGYPITPATDVMEYLTGRIEQYGGAVVQAEDELAAVNMALGAARAGARSMTATSGPGIDLMTETFGLVATTETPLVIANVMRSGPSTGMPTKQEQGDLNQMLYGGHGEVHRMVVAPTTVAECFHKTIEAFNLAEKYQMPVYLTADLSLAVTEQTYAPEEFDMDTVEIERGNVVDEENVDEWLDEKGRFRAHAATDDGISPRAFPGTIDGAHMTTGLEHDELGRRTEEEEVRVEQVQKRDRKVETAQEREEWDYREFGDPDADTLVISWGSNEGATREAIAQLEGELPVRFISVPYMFPRPDLSEEIEAAEDVIVVECNAWGQFADLIEHDALTRVQRINKYTGVRFKADELAGEIRDAVEKTEATA